MKDLTTWIGRRRIVLLAGALALLVVGAGLATAASSGSTKRSGTAALQSNNENGNGKGHVTVGHSVKNDKSPKLRDINPKPVTPKPNHPAQPNPKILHDHTNRTDTAVQNTLAAPKMPGTQLNFDGIGFPGVNCDCAPPDTNGEVGGTQS